MPKPIRRVVTGHDARGRSVVLSDAAPPQHHAMHGPEIGADFHEMWNETDATPLLGSIKAEEPNQRPFTIMPSQATCCGSWMSIRSGTVASGRSMHRTRTLDYVVVIEGELTLILDDSEVILKVGDVVVQRGTDHAWENRSARVARAAFFHIDARFSEELLAKLPKPLALMA